MHLKIVSASVALALLSTTAMAADLPSRRSPPVYLPPPSIPTFTWTGFEAGIQAGYQFGTSNSFDGTFGSGSPKGFIGGAHVGYLYQAGTIPFFGGGLGNALVFGVEGDVDGGDYHKTYTLADGLNAGSREGIQGSIRGRLGIAVDRALFYATGGAAFGGLTNTYYFPGSSFDSFSHTKVGYTVGGGIEYAFTNNWSARVEYRYTDYGSSTDNLSNFEDGFVTRREKDNRVEAGLTYKFDTFSPIAPVVARY